MLISNSQILETINILCARHQKILDDFNNSSNKNIDIYEIACARRAFDSIQSYEPFKQRYQTI